ncbi:MAG: hypothetical protein JWR69_2154 [Pedosphaera sp.]|nr:hypothetical protein [Pedosphaera sp.]
MQIDLQQSGPAKSVPKDRTSKRFRLACTGFVSEQAGSVAAANALLLRALLDAGMEIDFFSKPSFVDPRPAIGQRRGFRFVPAVNHYSDRLRHTVRNVPGLGFVAARNDAACYNRLLVRRMGVEHRDRRYDAVLWLGDYAQGRVNGVPAISFAQGPPGTDARSVLRHRAQIRRLSGWRKALKWELLARLRLSGLGLPKLQFSDHIIVGSSVSRDCLATTYRISPHRLSTLPYPIDLELFRPPSIAVQQATSSPLRLLWLGRIVPRKRLDLFLDGAALALRDDEDVSLTIVGEVGFVHGYDKLIREFGFPERLRWIQSLPREQVPELLQTHDVLIQPSEEENFGSSVAEAQACGLPVIVGRTNGNADYLCARDLHLADDRPETLALALHEMSIRRRNAGSSNSAPSRQLAEAHFNPETLAGQLMAILESVIDAHKRTSP